MTTIRYGDYIAKIDYEEDSKLFHGRVVNLRDVVNFYGSSAEELEAELERSVEEYLEICREEGIEPHKPFSGRFNVRLPHGAAPTNRRCVISGRKEPECLGCRGPFGSCSSRASPGPRRIPDGLLIHSG